MPSRPTSRARSFARILLATAYWGLVAVAADADGPARNLPFEVVHQAPAPLVAPVGTDPAQVTVQLPSVPARDGQALCLRFRALYPVKEFGARLADYYLRIEMNGQTVGAYMPDGSDRLLNRGRLSHDESGRYP